MREEEEEEVLLTGREARVASSEARKLVSALAEVRTVEGRSCSRTAREEGDQLSSLRETTPRKLTDVGQVPGGRIALILKEVELARLRVVVAAADLTLHRRDSQNRLPSLTIPSFVIIVSQLTLSMQIFSSSSLGVRSLPSFLRLNLREKLGRAPVYFSKVFFGRRGVLRRRSMGMRSAEGGRLLGGVGRAVGAGGGVAD